jgi:hypothetical protein
MSGTSGHFPDTFLNDSYNIPYSNVSHHDFNVLNHAHAPEVSLTFSVKLVCIDANCSLYLPHIPPPHSPLLRPHLMKP